MIKMVLSILTFNVCCFLFAKSNGDIMEDLNSKHNLYEYNLQIFLKNEHEKSNEQFEHIINKNIILSSYDSLKEIKKHGVFLEVFGKEIIYSLGYEFLKYKAPYALGFGIGTSFWRDKVLGVIDYNQYSLSGYFFYEYGKSWGVRTAINVSGKIYPIMYSDKLDEVVPPDKPPYLDIIPSFSTSLFFRHKKSNVNYFLNAYFLNILSRRQTFEEDVWLSKGTDITFLWFGITVKYNFKFKDK